MTKARLVRFGRFLAIALAAFYGLYVVGINVFLSTALFDRVVNAEPLDLDVHYRRGWSLYPGTIHAKNLLIRSSDSNVEWQLSLDEIDFDVSFVSLAAARFEILRAHGRGIAFRGRQKLDVPPATPDETATLAPVYGFPQYTMRPAGPPNPMRWDDSVYKLITVRLEKVTADDVREIWVDHTRFAGNARITGRFYLKPIRAVDVGPAEITIREGAVMLGDQKPIVTDLAGTSTLFIGRFDPREVSGRQFLRSVSGDAELRGKLVEPPIDLRRVALRIQDGHVTSGTRLEATSDKISTKRDRFSGSIGLEATAEVVDDVLHANVEVKNLDVRQDGVSIARAPKIEVSADGKDLDLVGDVMHDAHAVVTVPRIDLGPYRHDELPITIKSGHAKGRFEFWNADRHANGNADVVAVVHAGPVVGSGEATIVIQRWDIEKDHVAVGPSRVRFEGDVPNLGELNAMLPKTFRVEQGRPHIKADVTYPEGKGTVDVTLASGAFLVKDVHVTGDMNAHAKLGGLDRPSSTLDISGSRVSLRNINLRKGEATVSNWRGDVTLEDARVQLTPKNFDAAVGITAADATPLIDVFLRDSVPRLVAPLVEMPNLAGGARVRVAEGDVDVSQVDVRGGDVRVRGGMKEGFNVKKGPISINVGGGEAKAKK